MILIDENHVWEVSDEIINKLIPAHNKALKGRLTFKHKCILNQILDKLKRRPEIPALLKGL